MNIDDIKWWLRRALISPVFWFSIVLVWSLGKVGEMDLEDAIQADRNYCEMVSLYKSSDGQIGWPDYNERYDRDCL